MPSPRHITILFLDQWPLLEQCLKSLDATPLNALVTLIDTGSSGETLDRVRAAMTRMRNDSRLFHVDGIQNFVPEQYHELVGETPDYLLTVNSDTIVPPGSTERLFAVLERDPRIAAVGPVSNSPSELFQYREGLESEEGTLLQRIARFARTRLREEHGTITVAPYLSWYAIAFRYTTFLEVHREERPFGMGHYYDLDICCRFRRHGLLAIREDTFVWHRGHGTFRAVDQDALFAQIRERERIFCETWGHLPEHQELMQRMLYASFSKPR